MNSAQRVAAATALAAILVTLGAFPAPAAAQGRGRGGFNAPDPNLPTAPTAVALATISRPVTGPGTMYESVQSLPAGRGLDHYRYQATEYFVSGMAAGAPYKTRIVVRRPAGGAFSGLVLAEAMHPSGSAHMFEFNSHYLMSSGHAAVEIVTGGLNLLTTHNKARYPDISVAGDQVSEILAQVGSLIKEGGANSPLAGLTVRKMILAGTSATSAVLVRYLPGHMVYRTPGMQRIYDGFMPHSNGTTIRAVDVPLIQIPTMTEVASGTATARQDGDATGDQYRLYEFAGMAHVDSRDSVRLHPDPCVNPVTMFPLQAYLSVALHHLFNWVDKGIVPPRAPRVLVDRNTSNDGSLMALDVHGNPIGGIRNPYVDVPTAKNGVPNQGKSPVITNASAYIAAGGQAAANQMCGLAGYQIAFSRDTLRTLYGNKANYLRLVQAKVDEMEAAGWSLPVYREMILSDAAAVDF